jgi:hypothetical protein
VYKSGVYKNNVLSPFNFVEEIISKKDEKKNNNSFFKK